MRLALLPLFCLVPACAGAGPSTPSLAPRAAEAIDPRVPVAEPEVAGTAEPALVRELNALVAQAEAGDRAFQAVAAIAERSASAAGPPRSESWIVAQQALSAAIAARAPVTRSLGAIDALGARKVLQLGGIGPADLDAIQAAAARVEAIDAREASLIDRLQARLRG